MSDQVQCIATFALGRYVVVRTDTAGVHCGVLLARDHRTVLLSEQRRIWSWTDANTASDIAVKGVGPDSRVSPQLPEALVFLACEIMACTKEAEANLRAANWTETNRSR